MIVTYGHISYKEAMNYDQSKVAGVKKDFITLPLYNKDFITSGTLWAFE